MFGGEKITCSTDSMQVLLADGNHEQVSGTYHHHYIGTDEQHNMMDHIWPLCLHIDATSAKKGELRNVVLGTEGIVHVIQVYHKVPGPNLAPWNEEGRSRGGGGGQ
jgi:hypothetical protein